MEPSPKRHPIEWKVESIRQFWNLRTQDEDAYFCKQVGNGVLNVLRKLTDLDGRVVDYGCGPGYLLDVLLANGVACEGLDLSPKSVETLNRRQKANRLWGGANCITDNQIPMDDNVIDLMISCETLEHILDSHLSTVLGEMHRVVKKDNGRLFLTVPNNEKLSRSIVCCPECGCEFHRVQHLRSLNTESLTALMENQGFETIICQALNFHEFQSIKHLSIKDLSPRIVWTYMKHLIIHLLDRVEIESPPPGGRQLQWMQGGPHLFWFGKAIARHSDNPPTCL